MFEWRRLVLAFTVLILLVPVVAVGAPELLPSYLTPWMDHTDKRITALEHTLEDLQQTLAAPPNRAADETPTSEVETADESIDVVDSTTGPAPSTTTTADKSPSTTIAEPVDTTPSETTPTSTNATTAPTVSGGTLSGDVCGEVTSDATLVGNISLCGDLTVMGSGTTLSARPGVNVEGNGHQIMFMNGASADFQGSKTSTWSGTGANANLNRDVTFKNLRRIMFMNGAGASVLRYFSVHDSGGPATGEYPIHFHLNGNSTRGTIVEGVVVVNGRHHAFVPHGSHGITFKDTIAWNTAGDAYWWDPPGTNCSASREDCTVDNSNDTTYDHALAYGVTTGPQDPRGFRLAGFTLGAGSGNTIRNSVAMNINPIAVEDCSGFHWPEGANHNVGGNVWTFSNNYSHSPSGCNSVFVWQNDDNHHVINGLSGGPIDHGAYTNFYDYRDVDVPRVVIQAVDWQMSNSHVGAAVAGHHVFSGTITFTNVSFDSFTIDDGDGEPATYVLNGTNLTCGDIVARSVASGSQIVIDGQSCPL